MTADELLDEGRAIFDEWFSNENIEDSHVRSLFAMAYTGAMYTRYAPQGTTNNDLAVKMTAILCAAYQMGRAARD